jgi:phage protein D
MTDTIVPSFVLRVGKNYEVDEGVRQLIQMIEYESADGLADVMRIRAINPDFELSNSKIFAPGNEVSLYLGYGSDSLLKHVGRVKIYKNLPTFPKDGWPTFEAVGYTRDHELMHRQPETSSSGLVSGKDRQKGGRRFTQTKFSEAVLERAKDHGFKTDIDISNDEPSDFIQRAGMSDYDFIKGLSNITGFYFWVDGDENGDWTLHFKNPELYDGDQDRKLTFEYNNGNLSTLFSFEPTFLVTGAVTRIRARVRNVSTGVMMETEFQEDNTDTPDVLFDMTENDDMGLGLVDLPELESSPATSTAVQLFIGDYSFDDITSRRFTSEAQLINWARQWFRRQRENFIMGRGTCIGVEDVMARQLHNISGVGTLYDGEYFFSTVKHVLKAESDGYLMNFTCRKQTPPVT